MPQLGSQSWEWQFLPFSRSSRRRRADVRRHLPLHDPDTAKGKIGPKPPKLGYSDGYEATRSFEKRENMPATLKVLYSQLKAAKRREYCAKKSGGKSKKLAVGDCVAFQHPITLRSCKGHIIWKSKWWIGIDRSRIMKKDRLDHIEVVAAQYVCET